MKRPLDSHHCPNSYYVLTFQRSADQKFVPVSNLAKKDFDVSLCYRTVNPALAFQYVSDNPPEEVAGSVRVPAYFNNLNSWLGQTMQRDCNQVVACSACLYLLTVCTRSHM